MSIFSHAPFLLSLPEARLKDTFRLIHPNSNAGTFHAFGKTETYKIDYIYALGKIRVLDANIINESELFASDHLAVTTNLQFQSL